MNAWKCPDCGWSPKTPVKLRYPITCKCGERDYGSVNDPTIEFADVPRGSPRTEKHAKAKIKGGAGTELKRRLSWFSWVVRRRCSCNKWIRRMNSRGCDWCEQHTREIVEVLREAHSDLPALMRKTIPFVESLVQGQVEASINSARAKGFK